MLIEIDQEGFWLRLRVREQFAQTLNSPPVIINSVSCSGMSTNERRKFNMLWTIFVVLVILCLLGFSLHVGRGPDVLAASCSGGGSDLQLGQRSTTCRGVRFRIRSVDVKTTIVHGSSSALLRR
jgi:hypothetical protein